VSQKCQIYSPRGFFQAQNAQKPGPRWGSLRRSRPPRSPSRLGRGQPSWFPSLRLWRLDLAAFGAASLLDAFGIRSTAPRFNVIWTTHRKSWIYPCTACVMALLCSTAERRLYAAGALDKGATAVNSAHCGDVELASLRDCDADYDQHQQLKPHLHHQHHHPTDYCSYSHVWPVISAPDSHVARPMSTTTQRRYLGFDLQTDSDYQSEDAEHTYRSVKFTWKQTMLFSLWILVFVAVLNNSFSVIFTTRCYA